MSHRSKNRKRSYLQNDFRGNMHIITKHNIKNILEHLDKMHKVLLLKSVSIQITVKIS